MDVYLIFRWAERVWNGPGVFVPVTRAVFVVSGKIFPIGGDAGTCASAEVLMKKRLMLNDGILENGRWTEIY